jgi:hypothetical protein
VRQAPSAEFWSEQLSLCGAPAGCRIYKTAIRRGSGILDGFVDNPTYEH